MKGILILALSSSHDHLNKKVEMLGLSHLGFLFHEDNNILGILELVVKTTFLINNVPYKIFLQ